ncbi:MAG TPA: hypothetical protein VF171_09750, partial [Trueperaceae bacterium]
IVGANFRAKPTRASDVLQPDKAGLPKGTVVPVAYWVDGEDIDGDDQWAETRMYVNGAYTLGYFHRSVLGAPSEAPADCSEAVKTAVTEATAPLQERIALKDAYIAKYPKG